MKTAPSQPVEGARLAALDGLRGLAIMLVLLVHFVGDNRPRGLLEGGVIRLACYGIWGVDLFFVLSGFLITGILWDSKGNSSYFRDFYVRRTLRIFPLHYAVLGLLFVVLPALPVGYPAGLAEAARHQSWLWLYAGNLYLSLQGAWSALPYVGHFWSLAVEEHFYLVWPVVVLLCTRRGLMVVCAVCAASALALRMALASRGVSDVVLVAFTPCRLDALCAGAFLAMSARAVGVERLGRLARPALGTLGALVFLATAWNATLGSFASVVLPLRGTLVALLCGALLIASLDAPATSLVGRFFRSNTMRFAGKYSYGLYVFQGIVAAAFQGLDVEGALTSSLGSHPAAMLAQAFGGMGLSLALAIGSYELLEKPFLRLKDRFAPATRAPQVAA